MPAAVLQPPKQVLADVTNKSAGRKRRYDGASVAPPTKRVPGSQLGSSQPKSQFEEEVLEKLTQDISGLKNNNSEKDQQWRRPRLEDFDPATESLVFQQIEAEEGTLHGGKTTIKLFGTTEVGSSVLFIPRIAEQFTRRLAILCSCMSQTSFITSTSPPQSHSSLQTARLSGPSWRLNLVRRSLQYTLFRW